MAQNEDDEVDIRIVKMTLNTFCSEKTRKQFVARVQPMVATMNLAMAEAYTFANFHVTRCMSDATFNVSSLPMLDRNFYYRCILAVSTSNVRKGTLGADLEASVIAYDALRPLGYQKADVRPYNQVIADMSIQMATMACNSVWANLDRFILRYLRLKHMDIKTYWTSIIKAVVTCPKTPVDTLFDGQNPLAVKAQSVAQLLRSWMPLPSAQQFNTRAHLAMRMFHTILGELAKAPEDLTGQSKRSRRYKPRLFNLLPRKNGFTMAYLPVSSMTLVKLLSMGDAPIQKIAGDGRNEDMESLWRSYFNVNAVETRSSKFDNRITTDGKGVSIQMKVAADVTCDAAGYPKDARSVDCSVVASGEHGLAVGVDPGMTDVATCAWSNGEVGSFSSGQFSDSAGYRTSGRRTDKWNKETSDLAASIPSSKVTTVTEMNAHVRGYLAVLKRLLEHRATRGYRSMRFFRYVGKQKTIEKVCDMIAPRDKYVVVGFGNWANNGCGISRRCSGPIREIRRRLASRPNVMFKNVDEFRSSCTCHKCFEKMVNMNATTVKWKRLEDGQWAKVVIKHNKVHKVLHCRNSVCGATWNRDVNAAKNLLLLLDAWMDGKDRPKPFQRTTETPLARPASYRVHPTLDVEVSSPCDIGGLLS